MELVNTDTLTQDQYCPMCGKENDRVFYCPEDTCNGDGCSHTLVEGYIIRKCDESDEESDDQVVPEHVFDD